MKPEIEKGMVEIMKETIITSSALILGIVILRKLLRGKISAKLQYALWLLVAARLILPGITALFPLPLPESDYSLLNVTQQAESSVENYLQENSFPYQMTFSVRNLPFLTGRSDGPTSVFLAGHITWFSVLKGIWLAGITCAVLWIGFVNLSFQHYLYKNRTPFQREGFRLPVYLVEKLPSPCLYGFFGRQAVYITKEMSKDEEKLRHILAHEACHAAHGDSFWSLLRCALLAVYWFHPLVWLAAFLSKKDCELACDEGVIQSIGEEERISYGKTLISLVTRSTKPSDIVCTATTMTSGGKSMKERIDRIVNRPEMLAATVFFIIVLAALAVISTFTESSTPEIVTSGCFQLTLPRTLAKSVSCTVENETDILVSHRQSNTEIGRFRAMTLPEAMTFSDLHPIILAGNYGENASLRSYMDGNYEITVHHYDSSTGNDADETDYLLPDSGVPGSDSAVGKYPENFSEELDKPVSYDYLPNENITITSIPKALYCYFYVPSEDSPSEDIRREQMRINEELVSLVDTDSLSILALDSRSAEETLDILVQNRTPYVGNSVNVSQIAGALFVPDGMQYRKIELQTSEEPYKVTLDYVLTVSDLADIDQNILSLDAALLFATIENVDECCFRFNDSAAVTYYRSNLEDELGSLYPYSENVEKITELYNSMISATSN